MKIGIILSNLPGYSETFLVSMIKGVKSQGNEVTIFVFNHTDAKSYMGIPVKRQYNSKKSVFTVFRVVLNALHLLVMKSKVFFKYLELERSNGHGLFTVLKKMYVNSHMLLSDVVWFHFGYAAIAQGRENVAIAIGAKMSTSLRGYDINIYPTKEPGCYDLLWQRLNKVHSISQDLAKKAIDLGYQSPQDISIITPAIDLDSFKDRKRSFNKSGVIEIVTISRLHWVKGLDYVLRALAILKSKGLGFKLTIVGDGEERERLSFIAFQLGIEDAIVFKGKLAHDKTQEVLDGADIYLQYSVSEGFCNAVIEAQACGIPCIVSDAGGLSENVADGETGWVIPKMSPSHLARKIEDVMQLTDDQVEAIGQKGRERVKSNFQLDQQEQLFGTFFKLS